MYNIYFRRYPALRDTRRISGMLALARIALNIYFRRYPALRDTRRISESQGAPL